MNSSKRYLLVFAAGAAVVASAYAQGGERRATLRGGGGNDAGKCTIEVYVDGSAEVEIRGDRGVLRTLSGQPAQWRRFECTGPMPSNASDVRFSGVDGRGRQELVRDPRNGSGATVVRIEDRQGGGEGYTFDLEWRGPGFNTRSAGRPTERDRLVSPGDAGRACQDAVREKANEQYGLRDITFGNRNTEDNPGRNDTITGSFDVLRGNGHSSYHFSCTVDLASGRVRGVDISPGQGAATSGRNRGEGTSACERAVELRIQQDGYRNVQFSGLSADKGRNDWIGGTARAQQQGTNGRSYNFDVGCSVNLNTGIIRSVQANRR